MPRMWRARRRGGRGTWTSDVLSGIGKHGEEDTALERDRRVRREEFVAHAARRAWEERLAEERIAQAFRAHAMGGSADGQERAQRSWGGRQLDLVAHDDDLRVVEQGAHPHA